MDMDGKNKVVVTIHHVDYTIISNDSEDHVRRVADYVDQVIEEHEKNYHQLPSARIATLAALTIADELYKAKEERNELRRSLKSPNYALSNIKHDYEKLIKEHERKMNIYDRAIQEMMTVITEANEELGEDEDFLRAIRSLQQSLNRKKQKQGEINQISIDQVIKKE